LARPELSAVLIAGPTASGKSALALRLAQELGGAIINADSMQVYRDLRILTARPSAADERRAWHLLYGMVDGAINFSVGKWLSEARLALDAVRGPGRLPIFVGGSGLYFKALTQGLSAIPPVPEEVRRRLRRETAGLPAAALHARLAACDPRSAARLRPSDPQRVLRALEVFEAAGVPLAAFQGKREPPTIHVASAIAIFVAPDRRELAERIDARFDAMIEQGALEEAARLAERRLDPGLPVMRALGVPPLLAHVRGAISREEAIARAKLETRRYVKRQLTFARHQLPGFAWVVPEEAEAILRRELGV
jgi:tRNA dimethylallyltransferase